MILIALLQSLIVRKMGSCCCKRGSQTDSDKVELTKAAEEAHSDNVTCKCRVGGSNVVITPEQGCYTVKGTGTAIGSCMLDCDTAYFEIKILSVTGGDGVRGGVKRYYPKQSNNLNELLDANHPDSPAWYLSGKTLKDGDVIGIYWDQTDLPMLSFTLNGKEVFENNVNRIRPSGDVFPAVSVENSTCQFVFDEKLFSFPPKSKKFRQIICSMSII